MHLFYCRLRFQRHHCPKCTYCINPSEQDYGYWHLPKKEKEYCTKCKAQPGIDGYFDEWLYVRFAAKNVIGPDHQR